MAAVPEVAVKKYGIQRAQEAVNALAPIWLDLTNATMNGVAALHALQQQDPHLFAKSGDTPLRRVERFIKGVGETASRATTARLRTMPKTEHNDLIALIRKHKEFVWWGADGSMPMLNFKWQIDRQLARRQQRLTEFGIKRLIELQMGADLAAREANSPDAAEAVRNSPRLGSFFATNRDPVELRIANVMAGLPGTLAERYDTTNLDRTISGQLILRQMVHDPRHNVVKLDIGAINKKLAELPPLLPHESIQGDVKGCPVLRVNPESMGLLWHMTNVELTSAGVLP